MAYLRHYQAMGDPGFFGGLVRGIGNVAKGVFHLGAPAIPGIGVVGGAIGKFGGKLAKMPKGAKVALGAGALGAGALGAGALLGRHAAGARRRRINPGNVRALRRSMRRVESFAKLAHKTISFTHRVRMKKHRRK